LLRARFVARAAVRDFFARAFFACALYSFEFSFLDFRLLARKNAEIETPNFKAKNFFG